MSQNLSLQWVSWRYYTPRSSSFHASVIHSFILSVSQSVSQRGVYEPLLQIRHTSGVTSNECHIQSVNYWGHFTTVPAWGVDLSEHDSGAHHTSAFTGSEDTSAALIFFASWTFSCSVRIALRETRVWGAIHRRITLKQDCSSYISTG